MGRNLSDSWHEGDVRPFSEITRWPLSWQQVGRCLHGVLECRWGWRWQGGPASGYEDAGSWVAQSMRAPPSSGGRCGHATTCRCAVPVAGEMLVCGLSCRHEPTGNTWTELSSRPGAVAVIWAAWSQASTQEMASVAAEIGAHQRVQVRGGPAV